jgi:hypothetical protein
MRRTESLTNNKNIKKTVKNKALRGNLSQNPTRKARLRGAASVPSFATIFYIYINKNSLSIHVLWWNCEF